ncbi:hypothetical protein [Nonomuraea sp. NPDC023979]|uniref:hypothetical protein n=1 Tax=Nonomuraea sp. NPDC023979 TaxID=3154796 RepID=UPI0033C00667
MSPSASVGTACLTGAPAARPPAGDHPLTGAGDDQAGAALRNEPIRADQGIDVTFERAAAVVDRLLICL